MGALVQTKVSRFASFDVVVLPLRPRVNTARAVVAREPRAFPEAPTPPRLPLIMRDDILELYAFIFRQGGFRRLGLTFEQFLLVASAIKPPELPETRDGEWTL